MNCLFYCIRKLVLQICMTSEFSKRKLKSDKFSLRSSYRGNINDDCHTDQNIYQFSCILLLSRILEINIIETFSFIYISPFSDPFVGNPFASIKNWATSVKKLHIRPSTAFDIMPKYCRAYSRRN